LGDCAESQIVANGKSIKNADQYLLSFEAQDLPNSWTLLLLFPHHNRTINIIGTIGVATVAAGAEAIGIRRVNDVRMVVLEKIPLPNDPGLQHLALGTGLTKDQPAGMTFGHGVVLKNGSYDRRLIAHELVT
jgi:hypothetical protein